MAGSDKRVDVRLGAFACTIEGFDDPAGQLDQVFEVVKTAMTETPQLLRMADVDHDGLQRAVDAARADAVRVTAGDQIEDAEVVADPQAEESDAPVADPAAEAARRRHAAEPRHPPRSLYGMGRFAAGAAGNHRRHGEEESGRDTSTDAGSGTLSDSPLRATPEIASPTEPVAQYDPLKRHGDPFAAEASDAGRERAFADDGDQADAHDDDVGDINIFAAPENTNDRASWLDDGDQADAHEPGADDQPDDQVDETLAAVRATFHEAASPAMASAPEVESDEQATDSDTEEPPLVLGQDDASGSLRDDRDEAEEEPLLLGQDDGANALRDHSDEPAGEEPLRLGPTDAADDDGGEASQEAEERTTGSFRRLFGRRRSTETTDEAGEEAPLRLGDAEPAGNAADDAPLRLGDADRAEEDAPLRLGPAERDDESPLRLGGEAAQQDDAPPLRLGPAERADDEETLRLGADESADAEPPLRLGRSERAEEDAPLRLGRAERVEDDDEPLVLRHPSAGDESGGEGRSQSRFGAFLARMHSEGPRAVSEEEEDLLGSGDPRASQHTAQDFAEAFGASNVADKMSAAAAWLTLSQGQESFTRRQVMDVYEALPGDQPRTAEAEIKGFGRLMRAGDVEELYDGSFRLSDATRRRFESYLD